MPNRMQVNQQRLAYAFISQRDGEYCLSCFYNYGLRRGPPDISLEIDHADGDPSNWHPDNLHLLCDQCNRDFRGMSSDKHRTILRIYGAKNARARVSEMERDPTGMAKCDIDFVSGSTATKLNRRYEPRFRDFALEVVERYGKVTFEELRNSGAEHAGCSITTAERYLIKMCSATGIFRKYQDEPTGNVIVTFKYKVKRPRKARADKGVSRKPKEG